MTASALIIGAGPAGLTAAITCAQHGLQVTVLDEYPQPGGRLLGQLHQEPDGQWWNGIKEAARLRERANQSGVEIRCGVSVYHVERVEDVWVVSASDGIWRSSLLLLATGAAEIPLPLPGWTLPGVMSIGAAQVMTNVQRVRVGQRGIIIGINLLSAAIARELQLAGITIERMILPVGNEVNRAASNPAVVMSSLLRFAHLAPSTLLRWGSRWIKNSEWWQRLALQLYPSNGFKLWGIPVQLKMGALEICGEQQVETVKVTKLSPDGQPLPGSEQEIPADFVCIAGGLYPLAELAAVAGCPFVYLPELGGHVPLHSATMKTPLPGLYVAGNITGIESAKVAMQQGSVAGLSMVNEAGLLRDADRKMEEALRAVEQVRQQATIQFHPQISMGRSRLQQLYANHQG